MMSYLVLTYTEPGDVIADPFMGSGSTGVAALQEGRRFRGSEKEFEYFQRGALRLDAVQQQMALSAI